jgi:hypothetical protein
VSAFDKAIEGARQQIPAAFDIGGDLPYSDGRNPRPIQAEKGEDLVAGRAAVIETTIPAGMEDTRDFESAFKEAGFEAIAFYISFHRPTVQGQWGIFYFDHRLRQFAEIVKRELPDLKLNPVGAARLAFKIVRSHEQFHFRFDTYALYHELILRKPLYNEYTTSVYREVFCTSECFEEALANRACLEAEPLRRFFRLRIFDAQVKPFLKKLFAKAPPGYCDFAKPPADLSSGLGGQLLEGKPSARLSAPQSGWLFRSRPFRGQRCPEFFLVNNLDKAGKAPEFRFRRGRYIWQVHKNDADHWPSKPHAHDYDEHVKLDIRDGTVYDVRTRKPVGNIKKNELLELRDEIARRFPDMAIEPITA